MKIVDLFSGAGGLTFGFYYKLNNGEFCKTDNEFIFANEFFPAAAQAFKKNFPDINMQDIDIRGLTKEKIKNLIGNNSVDLIVGGPPCQSFSTVGQRRFDDKAKLYEEYLRILKIVRPKMFLFENVKGLLSMREVFYETDENGNIKYVEEKVERHGKIAIKKKPIITGYGDLIIDKIKEQFAKIDGDFGYEIYYQTLNAVDFGVPQYRERVFIIGIRKDLKLNWDWNFEQRKSNKLTIEEAISDFPIVSEDEAKTEYLEIPKNDYQRLMRKKSVAITQHFCGHYGDKIRTVIKNVKQGQGKNDFNALVDEGLIPEEYRLTSGYNNTYGRLVANQPSTTITNNLCTPSGLRCIHYNQDRALTPREGARIQSFPDWFEFYGTRTDVTKQIGNAVPPLLAMVIARKIEQVIGE
ncbi:MAG: DNA cytosine methyltransferase [Clostridia bacterium]|nr:DNA cytosine methyltransferase [Clostridia bacterium]